MSRVVSSSLYLPFPANKGAVLNRGLVCWLINLPNKAWGGGLSIRDIWSGKYNGTFLNGATWNPMARLNGFGSVSVEATGDTMDMGRVTELDGSATATISCWLWRGSTSNTVSFSRDAAFASDRVGIYFFSDGNTYYIVDTGSGQAYRVISNNVTGWHHFALVYDGGLVGAARITAYLNGVSVAGSSVGTPPATIPSVASTFKLGQVNGATTDTGKADDMRIYNRALDASEVNQLYHASLRGYLNEINWNKFILSHVPTGGATLVKDFIMAGMIPFARS